MRRLGALAVCLAVPVLLAGPGSGAAPQPLVKNVNGWITALAMDGSLVAYATETFAPTNCFNVFTWNVETRGGILVSGRKGGSCGSDEPHGQRVVRIAIAGKRLAWIRNITGNTESDDYLFTTVLPGPRERQLASATRRGDTSGGPLEGGWIGGLVGSDGVLAVNRWSTGSAGTVTRASLGLVEPTGLDVIARGPATVTAESAGEGRIAVARADGSAAIYSTSGTLLRTIAPSSLAAVALSPDRLVVLTKTRMLEVYDAASGALLRTASVPGGATNLDADSGIAVFSVSRTLYGVQLTTGKQVVLATGKRRIVAARIDSSGVVFAFNTVRGSRSIGNLAFLPRPSVQAAVSP
jgi:hypothetical protein